MLIESARDTPMSKQTSTACGSDHNTYGGILRSTALLGGARAVSLLVGLIRVKFIAELLGPVGVGLWGSYEIIVQTAVYFFGLGVGSSAIRQIAHATSGGDARRMQDTVSVVHRLSWSLGLIGMICISALCIPIGTITFAAQGYARPVMVLSVAVLFSTANSGLRAQLQGFQKTHLLARSTVIASCSDAATLGLIVLALGEKGIPLAIVAGAASDTIILAWAAQTLPVRPTFIRWTELKAEARPLIVLGAGLTSALLASMLGSYAIRSMINHHLSLSSVGLYLCAFALSGKFVGFLLDSSRADFFPRLSAAAEDPRVLNELINRQTEVVLLLATPGLLLTLIFAPHLITLLYSPEFAPADKLLAWFTLGCFWRVLWAPLGYIRLALGKSFLYFLTEAAFAVTGVGLAYLMMRWQGLSGVAAAYLVQHLCQTIVLVLCARQLTGFGWSASVSRLVAILFPFAVLVFILALILPSPYREVIGVLVSIPCGLYCVRGVSLRLGAEHRITMRLSQVPGLRALLRTSDRSG
jgi:antigen flippase